MARGLKLIALLMKRPQVFNTWLIAKILQKRFQVATWRVQYSLQGSSYRCMSNWHKATRYPLRATGAWATDTRQLDILLAFSGVNNIYKYYGGLLKAKEIAKLLASVESYTLRREYKDLKRNPSYSHFKRYQFQADLIDIQKLARWNDGVRYIFAVIDTFTRKAWIRPCVDKSADTILSAFKSIIDEAGKSPKTFVSDRGCELRNRK